MKNCSTIQSLTKRLISVYSLIIYPITNNKIFFINIILLLVIPSMINAYWINHEQYVTISNIYKFGIKIRDGANPPYIFFLPYVIAYISSILILIVNQVNTKIYTVLKTIIYCGLMLLFAINVFCLFNFKTMISPSIILLMSETNHSESEEFFNTYLLCRDSFIAYLAICIMSIYIFISEKQFSPLFSNRKWEWAIFLITLYMFQRSMAPINTYTNLFNCKNLNEAELWYLSYPVNTNIISNAVYSIYIKNLSEEEMRNAAKNTLAILDKQIAMKSINLIVIIGESYSKHHSNLYGYKHLTNPELTKQHKAGNLFLFTDVISSFNLTSFVLRNLFSVNSIMDNEIWCNYPAFPIIFKRAGYNVYFWDNQRTFGNADVSDFSIASYLFNPIVAKASYTRYNDKTFKYDAELINDFYKSTTIKGKDNLLIFHLMGQHTMPEKRYPRNDKRFEIFKKDSISRTDLDDRKKTLVAQYDNSTVYNDWVVANIIKHHTNENAVIIYFSDHGEEIYDFRDHYGRTQETRKTPNLLKYQYEIPFMIWCSNKFIEENPTVIHNIMTALDKPFMNDNVCQILFGLVGMQTKFYHPERDLLSPQFKPYSHRNVQGKINYEEVRWNK